MSNHCCGLFFVVGDGVDCKVLILSLINMIFLCSGFFVIYFNYVFVACDCLLILGFVCEKCVA